MDEEGNSEEECAGGPRRRRRRGGHKKPNRAPAKVTVDRWGGRSVAARDRLLTDVEVDDVRFGGKPRRRGVRVRPGTRGPPAGRPAVTPGRGANADGEPATPMSFAACTGGWDRRFELRCAASSEILCQI